MEVLNMKRSVSLLVVLAMIVTTFAGFATVAAQDEFVINFDAAFGIGAIAATPTAQEHTFFYTKGASATAGGWFGGAFPDGTTMVYTVNGGAEQAAGTSNAEPAVQGAVKATVPDATVFYRFSMDLTQTLNDTYQDGQEQRVEIFAKKPDGDRILLATFRTDLSKKVSLDKALFYEGDPITVTYNNADAENNDSASTRSRRKVRSTDLSRTTTYQSSMHMSTEAARLYSTIRRTPWRATTEPQCP